MIPTHCEGFGKTGEFTLAQLEGDSIDFLLQHRHIVVDHLPTIPFYKDLAEPMHRVLKRMSGTIVGLDYRGEFDLEDYSLASAEIEREEEMLRGNPD